MNTNANGDLHTGTGFEIQSLSLSHWLNLPIQSFFRHVTRQAMR